jgi:aspartyl-tRNA(Asn)/glutamyl-tRNA(Gln) amidotransferase subunit C
MSLTRENVAKVAKLARIRLEDNELDAMKEEINGILTWIDQLQQVNTDNIAAFTDQLDARSSRTTRCCQRWKHRH